MLQRSPSPGACTSATHVAALAGHFAAWDMTVGAIFGDADGAGQRRIDNDLGLGVA